MALGDVVNTVIDITARMDKEAYIRATVNSIIRSIASLRDFPETLVEAPVTVSGTATAYIIPLAADFRKVAYLRPSNVFAFLTEITPKRAMLNGREVVNCFYRSGNNLVVRIQVAHMTTILAYGYYAHPAALVGDGETNWVLDNYQDVIIDLLSAKVLRVTGDESGANALEKGVALRVQEIIADSAISNGVIGASNGAG